MNKTMVDSSNYVSIPTMELVPYDGRHDAHLTFMYTFNETVGKSRISAQAKLTHLLRYTVCKARLAIKHCSMNSNDGAYLMEIGYKSRWWARCNHVCVRFNM